ncbi:MAG: ribosome silencing factor [Candidatus Neomarinimicrobiota bacterium]|tara:strand:+ start:1478 stop:1807 length:330 start_codon:yes stop_codon:yes gene_type:complete
MSAKKLLKQIVSLSDDKKAENIVAMDVSNITSLSEYFVVCSASNLIQVKAIADNIKDNIEENPWRTEGYENGTWIILDYVDIVVHIFLDETRQYYDLERIWFDAKVVKI